MEAGGAFEVAALGEQLAYEGAKIAGVHAGHAVGVRAQGAPEGGGFGSRDPVRGGRIAAEGEGTRAEG